MANALDHAEESAAAQNGMSKPDMGEETVSAPKTSPEAKPETPPSATKDTGDKQNRAPVSSIPMPDISGEQATYDPVNFPPVTLNNRYVISPSLPLPELNSPSAMAYSAEDRREPGRHLFALICKPGLPVRTRLMAELKDLSVIGMLPLIDFGPIKWQPIQQTTLAVVFERPMGGRFISTFGDKPPRVNEYELGRTIVEPIAQAISELTQIDFAHRAIRLDNLFFMDKEKTHLVVGECVTSPPGFDQPVIYEPLDRAYAMPSGRGSGFSYDDMYALGITASFALLGYNPVAKLNEDQLLSAKAEHGSYQCICGNERIPLPLIEPLRGLLSDEEFERWNMEALETWVNGQKKTPIQRRPAQKPKTAFKFGGRDHRTVRSIAHSLSKNVPEAIKLIKNGKLEQWLRSSLGHVELADSIASVITMGKVQEGSPDGTDEIMVSKISMRLDPRAPIRYKTFSFLPDGFGTAMAIEYMRKGNFQIPGEILARDLVSYWFASQENRTPDMNSMDKSFQTLRGFAKINEWGYGMERCLYELNHSLPCQSDILRNTYVGFIEDLLPSLDSVADDVDNRSRPIDKHIVAYVATHLKYDITPHLKAISDPSEQTSLIGMLSLYALMQWRQKIETLYGLSSWLGGLLAPAIGTYHSRTTRRKIEQEIPALVRQGSLPELFDLIDNAERRTIDKHDFEEAQIAFAQAEAEIGGMVGEGVDQEKAAMESGERITAILGITLSMIATVVVIFVQTM